MPAGKKCKVCTSKLRTQIDQLILNGASSYWVADWCSDKGFSVTHATISRHSREHLEGYESKNHKVKKVEDYTNSIEYIEPTPTIVELDKYLEKIGLTELQLIDIENYLDENIGAFQKAINLIIFKNLALVDFKIDETNQGQGKYPIEKIKGLKILSEIYFKAVGIDVIIDENVALEHLLKRGYKIEKSINLPQN